jgi:Flp pilus assembly protein TadG
MPSGRFSCLASVLSATPALSWLPHLWRDRAGISSVEFAALAPVLLTLSLGVIEYGRAYKEQISLASMASANLQRAIQSLGAVTVIEDIDSYQETLPNGDTLDIAARRSCSCLGVTSACNTLCDGTSLPTMTIEVTATRNLSPIVVFPGHDGDLTLTATAVMRAR